MNEFVYIKGFEPAQINRDGVVISRLGKRLKPQSHDGHYPAVKLKGKRYSIHRLLAKQFIPNPNNYPMINHIDGNKMNYSLDNLEWCTLDQNMKHAQRTGLLVRGVDVHTNVLDEIQVLTIRQCLRDQMRINKIALYFNVQPVTIRAIADGRNWKHLCPDRISIPKHKAGTKVAKLGLLQVSVIKEAISARHKLKHIAKYFKVHPVTITDIKAGRTWRNVA